MRRATVFFAAMTMVLAAACAGEQTGDVAGLKQGLTVLSHSETSLDLAYRQGDVVIYMQAKRGKETPELYQFDTNSPRFEVDTRFTDANGFIFHVQQGGHGWLDASWGEALKRQMADHGAVVGSNEVLFRVATAAAATLYADVQRELGPDKALALVPELDAIHGYAALAHQQYTRRLAEYQQWRRDQGLEELPTVPGAANEVAYGTPGPDDPYWYYTTATDYSLTLHADKLDGIPGYAGGYHSATQRHAWSGGAIYWSHSSNNHGRAAEEMTQRGDSGYKAFAANELNAYHCLGDYEWDSDGGYYGHNCHDDSRIQMHNFAYKSAVWGTFRWCDGGDRDHDISVDILFVELDQDGYPSYSTSTNKGYGAE